MSTRENTHVEHDSDLSGSDLHRGGDRDRLGPTASRAGRSDFSLFDAGLFDDLEHGLSLGDLGSEDHQSVSFNPDQEPHHAQKSDFPQLARRRRPKAVGRLTEEDFEPGAQRSAFSLIDHYTHILFKSKPKPQDIAAAIAFFFTVTDDGGITFKSCCDVLRAREDVLRLRIQYEWWLRGTFFTGPFPFMAVPMPRDIAGEVVYYTGKAGYALAREAFIQPGIEQDELLDVVRHQERASLRELSTALEHLEDRFLMSSQVGRWWTTGRNPMLMLMRVSSQNSSVAVQRGGSIHWSRLFGMQAQ
jgi:hypothetical protein